jgi:hypothetical protein
VQWRFFANYRPRPDHIIISVVSIVQVPTQATLKHIQRIQSGNPNQQAAVYTERMFMPRPELVLVGRFEIHAESVFLR